MTTSADSMRIMRSLFQAREGGAAPTSALQLFLETIDFQKAKALNRLWHSRLPRMGTGCIDNQPFLCFAAIHDCIAYAVAIWSNPVARNLPQDTWLELRRLAVAPDAPRNTCSRMLAVMARLIRRLRPNVATLVSYHDTAVHGGGIYRAAGWKSVETPNSNTNWNMPGRPRPASQSEAPKQRWELSLRQGGHDAEAKE